MVDGCMTGAELMGDMTEPSEAYKGNTILLICWHWGYGHRERYKTGD